MMTMEPEVEGVVKKSMDFFNARGVTEILRVLPDPDLEIGFDMIAERIVQFGGVAEGTIRMAAERTRLPEYPLLISAGPEHVAALSHALAYLGESVRAGIAQAGALNDADTADMLTEISRGVDKHLWFVEAHHQARA